MYWNEYKTKSENKNTTNEYIDIFTNHHLSELTDCFCQYIQIKMTMQKGVKAEGIIYQNVSSTIIASSSMEKTVKINWSWYKMIRRNNKVFN